MSAPSDDRHHSIFAEFFHSQVAGSIALGACAIAALVWANSPWADSYYALAHTYIGISWGELSFKMSLEHWVKDGLMGIFFFVVGLEIKREVVVGELSSVRNAMLPVSAALGGAAIPALIYVALNAGTGEGARGWGIPMATDIAFALGLLSLFGTRAPVGLKVFLTALAIADDLLAVLVIAVFYTEQVNFLALVGAALALAGVLLVARANVRAVWIYWLLGTATWAFVLASGVHATVAGVLVALCVPVRAAIDPERFLTTARRRVVELEESGLTRDSMIADASQRRALDDLYLTVEDMRPPGLAIEHDLHPVQSFLILPLFALVAAGVTIGPETLESFPSSISLGIAGGLVVGKPLGILAAAWLAVRSGRADLPEGVSWGMIGAVGCLAGIGFTMSIFIGDLAFRSGTLVADAKLGILLASVAAGVTGTFLLNRFLPRA